MADVDVLARIDRTLERIDIHMERGNAHMERGNHLVERIEAEFQKNREYQATAMEEWREFTRTMILRVERFGRDQIRELSRMNDELRDLRLESRAQTQALLSVVDRMDRLDGGLPPAAA